MKRTLGAALITAYLGVSVLAQDPSPKLWFSPAPGSIDYTELFNDNPDSWPSAREKVDVFQFYDMHAREEPVAAEVGPNSYQALRNKGAFTIPAIQGKGVAMESGYIKGHNCNSDKKLFSALDQIILDLENVKKAGGKVNYLVLQEPFYSVQKECGLDPYWAADMIAVLEREVRKKYAPIEIGLVEAFPTTDYNQFTSVLKALESRNVTPDFVHLDIDLQDVHKKGMDLSKELTNLSSLFEKNHVPWGIVLWSGDSQSPVMYQDQVMTLAHEIKEIVGGISYKPSRYIVQSWAGNNGQIRMNPPNLPDDKEYSHTYILRIISDMFQKQELK